MSLDAIYDTQPLAEVCLRLPGAKAAAQRRNYGKDARGEWDWYYDLPVARRRALARWHMSPHGTPPDVLATSLGTDTDTACLHWLAAIDSTRSGDEWDEENLAADLADFAGRGVEVWASDLVGPIEIAERLGVERQTVHAWRYRGVMPDPIVTLSGVPIFSWETIEVWAAETGRLPDHRS